MELKSASCPNIETIDTIVDDEINKICAKYEELSVKADQVLDRLRKKKKQQPTE